MLHGGQEAENGKEVKAPDKPQGLFLVTPEKSPEKPQILKLHNFPKQLTSSESAVQTHVSTGVFHIQTTAHICTERD